MLFDDPALDDEIGRALKKAWESGELKQAPSYGKPLPELAGGDPTPEEMRLPFGILKRAGVMPAEVELLRRRAHLRDLLGTVTNPDLRARLQKRLAEVEQSLAMRLEALRGRSGR